MQGIYRSESNDLTCFTKTTLFRKERRARYEWLSEMKTTVLNQETEEVEGSMSNWRGNKTL